MVQHHFMGFTAYARLFIAAERRMSRVCVITVSPDAPGLNTAPHLIRQITVAAPDARPQPVLRIVCQRQRLFHGFKGRHRQHRAKYLLLEDAHIVFAVENGRLEVIALFQFTLKQFTAASG